MSIPLALGEARLAAAALILAFALFAVGGVLPLAGARGGAQIFSLSGREHLLAVAESVAAWRWANLLMGAASVTLLAGLSLLTQLMEAERPLALARLGLIGWLLATALWLIFSAFRAVVTPDAARELLAAGSVPAYYDPLARWGFALFGVSAGVGFLAIAAYGGAWLQAGLGPAWVGWATLIFCAATLAQLLLSGDTLPALHYLPPLVIGVVLLLRP